MLYPDFKELLSYESAAKGVKLNLKKKIKADISGNFLSHFKGQGMEFDDVREYRYGDDVRNIDWRTSAKKDATFIKTFREERERNVVICIDNNDYMNFGTRNTFKNVQAARIASILGFAANKNNDKVGLYIYGNQKNRFSFFKPASSKKSIFLGLKTLCAEKKDFENYSTAGAIFNLKRIDSNANIIFIISDFRDTDEQLERNLHAFGRNPQIVLINILDISDRILPDFGKVNLEYGARRYLLNSSNRRGAERYKRIHNEKLQNIKKMAARLNAKLINVSTQDDALREIAIGLK